MTFILIIIILLACFVLVKGADLTIKALSGFGEYFNWSGFIVSFGIMALATSLPELSVGIFSSIHRLPQISFGNVIGANIINLTLILGFCTVLARKIKIEDKKTEKKVLLALILAFFPVILALDQEVSRLDGLTLILILILYFFYIFDRQEKIPAQFRPEKTKGLRKMIVIFVLGISLLLGSSEVITRSAKQIAEDVNIPTVVIGLILVALGTTMPEFIFGVRAALRKHQELSLGNSLGTVVINSNLVLGLVSLIQPIKINYYLNFLSYSLFFLLAIIIFYIFARSKKEINWKEGMILIIFYIIFVIFQLI